MFTAVDCVLLLLLGDIVTRFSVWCVQYLHDQLNVIIWLTNGHHPMICCGTDNRCANCFQLTLMNLLCHCMV